MCDTGIFYVKQILQINCVILSNEDSILQLQSNLTLKAIKIRENLTLRDKSQVTNYISTYVLNHSQNTLQWNLDIVSSNCFTIYIEFYYWDFFYYSVVSSTAVLDCKKTT